MQYLAIVAWTVNNRLAKYQDFETEQEADAHVGLVARTFPDAFVASHPGGGPDGWLIDPVAKTISLDPPPPRVVDSRIRDIPVSVDSVAALRDAVNDLKALLRGE